MSLELTEEIILKEPFKEYNSSKDFASLKAWQKCNEVKMLFYKNIISVLPEDERFNLGFQMQKAAISITANIAEGYRRYHYKEGIQFYLISRGSLYELKDHLISCHSLNLITNDLYNKGAESIEEAKVILNGFLNCIKKQQRK